MIVINEEKFKNKKRSDTLVVYGSGGSISGLKTKDIDILSRYDSIGFNWFCKSKIFTTFYLVREQANINSSNPKYNRCFKDETPDILFNELNTNYIKSCLIVCDVSGHSNNVYNYAKHIKNFAHEGIIVKDINLFKKEGKKINKRYFDGNILSEGNYHWVCTMGNILHFALYMGYSNIIFVGVDLYDSRYFWIPENSSRHTIKNKNKKNTDVHPICGDTLNLIRFFKKNYDINMRTYNEKSLLSQEIEVYCNEN